VKVFEQVLQPLVALLGAAEGGFTVEVDIAKNAGS
jgi:hypothetical protein